MLPAHDRRELTRACLEALRAQTCERFTTVVVDDGSTDGTNEMLIHDFPEVVTLRGSGELWWTGATNVGCAWALAHAPAEGVVVTLNDDSLPEPDWLSSLLEAGRESPGALVGSLVYDAVDGRTVFAGQDVDWWTARYSSPWRGVPHQEVARRAPALLPTTFLGGNGTLIPARALRQLGPFDRALPHYGADYELSRRAACRGWRLVISRDAALRHNAATTGLRARRGESLTTLALSLWSRRSSTAWPYRMRFALRTCPPAALPSYLACDAVRTLGAGLRDYLRG